MKDVALKAGVHTTTVSLVLRNSGRISLKTRRRIQALAKEMGYHEDPMLSALVSYRANRSVPKIQPTVAVIFDFKSQEELDLAPNSHRNFLDGILHKAEELGYLVQSFFFTGRNRSTEGRRLGRILFSRGIKGVILCAFRSETEVFEIDWDRFSLVQIECQHLGLPLHMVSTDQMMMAREAVRRLWRHGYRRIGIAVGRGEETYLDHAFTVGFHGEAALHPDLKLVPPLLMVNGETAEQIAPHLRRWIERYEIEAVISNWMSIPDAIKAIPANVRPDTAVVELGSNLHEDCFGGMVQRDAVVGERALEQLAMLLKLNQTGWVDAPNRIMIPGIWVDGKQLPVTARS